MKYPRSLPVEQMDHPDLAGSSTHTRRRQLNVDIEPSEQYFENFIEDVHINKKFSVKHFELAELYLTYNRFDEALFEYKKSSALDPENLDIKLKMAKVLAKKGFISKAIDELKKLKNENLIDFILVPSSTLILYVPEFSHPSPSAIANVEYPPSDFTETCSAHTRSLF